MILVIFSGWVHDRAGLHADLLEEIPHFLINVLLEESEGHSYHGMTSHESPSLEHEKVPSTIIQRKSFWNVWTIKAQKNIKGTRS